MEIIRKNEEIKRDLIDLIGELQYLSEDAMDVDHHPLRSRARTQFFSLHPTDQAEVLRHLRGEKRSFFVSNVLPYLDPEVFLYLAKSTLKDVVRIVGAQQFGNMISVFKVHDIVELLCSLSDSMADEAVLGLSMRKGSLVNTLLSYPKNSAGRMMGMDFVSLPNTYQVGEILNYLHDHHKSSVHHEYGEPEIFLKNSEEVLVGCLSIVQLFKLKSDQVSGNCASDISLKARVDTDIDDILHLFIKYELKSLPVINDQGCMIGVIEFSRISDLIHTKVEGDILNISGIFESSSGRGVLAETKVRFAWLFVNLLTAIVASSFIGMFEGTIAKYAVLAVLMPITASMGGNGGTQSSAVILRAIVTRTFHPSSFVNEVLIALLNGAIFGTICLFGVMMVYHNLMLSVAFGTAIFITLFSAGFFGALLPIVIDRVKLDPAVVTTVFLTTVTDIVGFFSFLALAKFLIKI